MTYVISDQSTELELQAGAFFTVRVDENECGLCATWGCPIQLTVEAGAVT